MPEREKAVERIVERAYGGPWVWTFGGLVDQAITTEEYLEAFDKVDALYEHAVSTIDWNRVILEASSRCLALDHDHGRDFFGDGWAAVCGESIEQALLNTKRVYGPDSWLSTETN